jgi:hypothetical protein
MRDVFWNGFADELEKLAVTADWILGTDRPPGGGELTHRRLTDANANDPRWDRIMQRLRRRDFRANKAVDQAMGKRMMAGGKPFVPPLGWVDPKRLHQANERSERANRLMVDVSRPVHSRRYALADAAAAAAPPPAPPKQGGWSRLISKVLRRGR